MEVMASSIRFEIDRIFNDLTHKETTNWKATIHTPTSDIDVLSLTAFDVRCDFIRNYADELVVSVLVGLGTYKYDIVPNVSNLSLTLTRSTVVKGGLPDISRQRYRAILINPKNDTVTQNHSFATNKEQADVGGMATIMFELKEPLVDYIATCTVGGIYRLSTPESILRSTLSFYRGDSNDTTQQLQGVTIQPPHNTQRGDVIIPHGTPVVVLGDLLQRKLTGVYSTGIATYYQKGFWYVWGVYDLNRQSTKSITIIMVPPNILRGVDRTYRTTENQLIILATGSASHLDNSEGRLSSEGRGARYTDPDSLFGNFTENKEGISIAARSKNLNEYVVTPSENNINKVTQSGIRSSKNKYHETSLIVQRNGGMLQIEWQHSDRQRLQPDLPITVMYSDKGVLKTHKATLLGHHTYHGMAEGRITNTRLIPTTVLTLFIERVTA